MFAAIIGGMIIGLAATLMMLFNGRVMGVSGIIGGIVAKKEGDFSWRFAFFFGLLSGGLLLSRLMPEVFLLSNRPWWLYGIAGFFVGFGTLLGNGCTSGHGVCGLSRFSTRSLISTLTFIAAGMITVWLTKGNL